MGHRQVGHILKYTKKKCCTTSCLNLIKIPLLQLTILYSRVISVCVCVCVYIYIYMSVTM